MTAILGIASVVWYGWGPLDERDVEDEIKRKVEAKQNKIGIYKKLRMRN